MSRALKFNEYDAKDPSQKKTSQHHAFILTSCNPFPALSNLQQPTSSLPHTKPCTSYLNLQYATRDMHTLQSRHRAQRDACTTCSLATDSGKALHPVWRTLAWLGIIPPLTRYLRYHDTISQTSTRYVLFSVPCCFCHYVVEPSPSCRNADQRLSPITVVHFSSTQFPPQVPSPLSRLNPT